MRVLGITIVVVIFLLLLFPFLLLLRGSEDRWIKDERGVYIKHGYPANTPVYVKWQQEAINCSMSLYEEKKSEGMDFSSQCLGTCGNYAIDIAHVPRLEEDNLEENQCQDFREGKVTRFIELDEEGEIIRIH